MATDPKELALRAAENIHTLCMTRSGYSYLGDIPLKVSVSTVSAGKKGAAPKTSTISVKPDVARLLDTRHVSDDLYEEIHADPKALTEGECAERLADTMNLFCGNLDPEKRKPVRFSLSARRDMNLLRNFIWREGYAWQKAEGGRQRPTRIVDVRHALTILAGIGRVMGVESMLPAKLRGYDLEPKELTAAKLCKAYGVRLPKDCAESSALLRLLVTARTAEYTPPEPGETAEFKALRALGSILDHLEGVAGVLAESDAHGDAKKRARQLITPLRHKADLSPSDIGLLHYDGEWLPVVQPKIGALQSGNYNYLYSLPDGRPLPRHVNLSAPLARMDLLASERGWDAAADERLKRLCGREGEAFSFAVLKQAFEETASSWAPPEEYKPSPPTEVENSWARIYDGWPSAKSYRIAEQAARAINKGDSAAAFAAFDALAEARGAARGSGLAGAKILQKNLQLVASRANLSGDGRIAWLHQMALLPNPAAWPGSAPIEEETLTKILYGDGAVACHNRTAVQSRHAVGIPASKSARAAISAPPARAAAAAAAATGHSVA